MLVHYIVVLQDMLSGVKIKTFNFCLGRFYRPRHQSGFYWLVFGNIKRIH